jgi:hypothetical protein
VRRTAVALALALALAVAGCADELEEFRDDLRPLEQRAASQRARISSTLRSVRLGSRPDARLLRQEAAALKDTYDEIAMLEPPDRYARPFAAYVRANDRAGHDLDRFAAELAAGDARGLRQASRRVVQNLGRSQSARLHWLE